MQPYLRRLLPLALLAVAGSVEAASYTGIPVEVTARKGYLQFYSTGVESNAPCQSAEKSGIRRTIAGMPAASRIALLDAWHEGTTIIMRGTGDCIGGVEVISSFSLLYPDME